MHIRPKSGFSHCRAGDCSELSHMLLLFIYLDLFFFTCFLFLKMSILICPDAVAQFMAVVYLCFETLSIITPTHAILMTRIRCHFQGPLMVIVSRALKTTYTSAGISFVLQDSVGMNASDRSDAVTVCVPVGFSLLSCCRTGKTFRWSWTRLADSWLSAPHSEDFQCDMGNGSRTQWSSLCWRSLSSLCTKCLYVTTDPLASLNSRTISHL